MAFVWIRCCYALATQKTGEGECKINVQYIFDIRNERDGTLGMLTWAWGRSLPIAFGHWQLASSFPASPLLSLEQ
jgi:hypothetical protein